MEEIAVQKLEKQLNALYAHDIRDIYARLHNKHGIEWPSTIAKTREILVDKILANQPLFDTFVELVDEARSEKGLQPPHELTSLSNIFIELAMMNPERLEKVAALHDGHKTPGVATEDRLFRHAQRSHLCQAHTFGAISEVRFPGLFKSLKDMTRDQLICVLDALKIPTDDEEKTDKKLSKLLKFGHASQQNYEIMMREITNPKIEIMRDVDDTINRFKKSFDVDDEECLKVKRIELRCHQARLENHKVSLTKFEKEIETNLAELCKTQSTVAIAQKKTDELREQLIETRFRYGMSKTVYEQRVAEAGVLESAVNTIDDRCKRKKSSNEEDKQEQTDV